MPTMLRQIKAKNARTKRVLDKRAPQLVENTKQAVFMRHSTASQRVLNVLRDLHALKKPDGVIFSKKNDTRPFEDASSLEFLSQKNDASLFAVASHSKKRPDNLVLARMFNHSILDMVELGVDNYMPMSEFKSNQCASGNRPMFLFQGAFETSETLQQVQNIILDFFRGDVAAGNVALGGLEHVIVLTATSADTIAWRAYAVLMKKSGTRLPRIELEEMGPRMDLTVRRTRAADRDMLKSALKVPKELKPVKEKNISSNILGDKMGRIHLGRQALDKLQTRKVKALKRARDYESDDDDEDTLGAADETFELVAGSSATAATKKQKKA